MNKWFSIGLLAGLSVMADAGAQGRANGWYLHAYVGVSGPSDGDFTAPAVPNVTVESEYDAGFGSGGALGYQFGLMGNAGLKFEGEVSYRAADVDTHEIRGAGAAALLAGTGLAAPTTLPGSTGDLDSWAYMANLLLDFNRGGTVNPYVGLGFGGANVDYSDYGVTGVQRIWDDDDFVFAYQFMAGLEFQIDDHWYANAEYRYFETEDPDINTTPVAGVIGAIPVNAEYNTHNVNIGLSYLF